MPDSTPKQQLDLEDLALHEGATVLLRRALAQLRAGDWFEVRGDSAQLAEQLAVWCRKEGHRCEPKRWCHRSVPHAIGRTRAVNRHVSHAGVRNGRSGLGAGPSRRASRKRRTRLRLHPTRETRCVGERIEYDLRPGSRESVVGGARRPCGKSFPSRPWRSNTRSPKL